MIYGLKAYYPNIPIVDSKYSIKEFGALTAVSRISNIRKSSDNYYDNSKNYFNKIYSMSNVKKDASELYTQGKSLIAEDKAGLFQSKIAVSSDDKKITAVANKGAANKTYSIKVENTAAYQSNKSTAVNSSEKSAFTEGYNSFTITSGGKSKDIYFKVEAGDSNEKALNNMVGALNNSDFGVKASVVKDTKNNSMYMKIDSKDTGKDAAFEITDKVGNTVSISGVANKIEEAKDAKYNVNGVDYSSKSNNVAIDKGTINLNLKESTVEAVRITVKNDNKKIESGIENFVNSYNKFTSNINSNDFDYSILKASSDALKRNENRLKSVGININEDRSLSIDKERLKAAIENNSDKVKNIFLGYTGIANSITHTANAVERTPSIVMGVSPNFGYNNNYALMQYSTYQGSLLNKNV